MGKSKKILIMVHALTGGGAERVAASWANGLSELGHEVLILTNTNRPQTYSTNENVKILPNDPLLKTTNNIIKKLITRLIGNFKNINTLRKYLNSFKPDVVINVLFHQTYPLLISKILSYSTPKLIMTDHNSYEKPEGVKMKFKQKRNKFFDNKFFDKVTVLTHQDKDLLVKKGFTNVEVLYNPLFIEPVQEIPKKDKIILAVGRINQWHYKGFDLLIKAWNEVYPMHTDWKLRIVGHGSKENIEMLCSLSQYPESIEIHPFTPNIIEEYRRASIFVLSSRYEGWGLVLTEAMSQGCACIACDYKGRQAEIIQDGVNGLLCEVDNSNAIAKKIKLLISDKVLRLRLAENAIRSLNQFSEIEVAKNLEKIITSIAK